MKAVRHPAAARSTITIRLAPALCVLTLLSACAGSTDYPSLAIRDVERVQGSASAADGMVDTLPALPPASADLTTRLSGLLDAARASHQRFESRRPATERAVGAAGPVGTPGWAAAQVALTDLQTTRSGGLVALAELDEMYVDARAANPEQVSPSAAAIATARDQVDAWVAGENSAIERLNARLKS